MNVFDIIGPVMIGPSSSHTAGAARIGRFAYNLLGEPARKAEILLCGSFAKTFRGHGTDKALVGGILGMKPDDGRIRGSLELAEQQGLEILLTTGELPDAHPNTARVTLWGESGKITQVVGQSVGGGAIRIVEIDKMTVDITGSYDTLIVIHQDTPGAIAAVTQHISQQGGNICNIQLSRLEKGGRAMMSIEVDGWMEPTLPAAMLLLPQVHEAVLIPRL